MIKTGKYLLYCLLLLNIHFFMSCCTAGKTVDKTVEVQNQSVTPDRSRDISSVIVLDAKTDISSPWVSQFILPEIPGAFTANDFTFVKGAARLENSATRFGHRIKEKTIIERRDSVVIYRVTMEITSEKNNPNLTNAYSRTETVNTTFDIADLAPKGKVLYQPARYALLKGIANKAASRGQVGLSSLEYLNNGHFKAEVIIRY